MMAIAYSGFNLRAFFVIVPGRDQKEGNRVFGIVIAVENFQCVFEGLPAATVHVAIQAPRCLGVVESRPNSTYNNLAGTVFHFVVEPFEIIFAPVPAVGVPCAARMYPGIIAIK